eukprot:Opistho-1_new@51086
MHRQHETGHQGHQRNGTPAPDAGQALQRHEPLRGTHITMRRHGQDERHGGSASCGVVGGVADEACGHLQRGHTAVLAVFGQQFLQADIADQRSLPGVDHQGGGGCGRIGGHGHARPGGDRSGGGQLRARTPGARRDPAQHAPAHRHHRRQRGQASHRLPAEQRIVGGRRAHRNHLRCLNRGHHGHHRLGQGHRFGAQPLADTREEIARRLRSHHRAGAAQHVTDHHITVPACQRGRRTRQNAIETGRVEFTVDQRGQRLFRRDRTRLVTRQAIQIDLCGIHDGLPELSNSQCSRRPLAVPRQPYYQRFPVWRSSIGLMRPEMASRARNIRPCTLR